MTVETQSGGEPILKSGPYNGDGSTATFDYDFPIQANTELEVIRQNADLSETVLVLTTDYTVSGVGADAGGSITLVDPATDLPTGTKLIIRYDGDFLQSVNWSNQSAIQLSQLEASLDKMTMHLRQMQERVSRTIQTDAFSSTDLATLTANVAALAALETEITALGAITADISTVAGDSADIATVAGISAQIATVAAAAANIATVASNIANVNTVAGLSTQVTTLAAIAADITAVANAAGGTLAGIWTFSSTSHLVLPRGTSAQQPGTPAAAMVRVNSDNDDRIEHYDGAGAWKTVLAAPAAGLTQGRIAYVDSNGRIAMLAVGTNGQVLTLASGVPSWADAATGLDAVLLYDQTVPSTTRGDNISSVTDNAAGDATINFTNSFNAADYAATYSTSDMASTGAAYQADVSQGSRATGTVDVETFVQNNTNNRTNADNDALAWMFKGTLA